MRRYTVEYRMRSWESFGRQVCVNAKNKWDALDKATYELIPEKEGEHAYEVRVASVLYRNGRVAYFN